MPVRKKRITAEYARERAQKADAGVIPEVYKIIEDKVLAEAQMGQFLFRLSWKELLKTRPTLAARVSPTHKQLLTKMIVTQGYRMQPIGNGIHVITWGTDADLKRVHNFVFKAPKL